MGLFLLNLMILFGFFYGLFLFLRTLGKAIGIAIGEVSYGCFWLLRPEEAKQLKQRIRDRFLSFPSRQIEQELMLLDLIRNQDWLHLEGMLQKGCSKEKLYNSFSQLREWENGAQFAEKLKDSQVARWFRQEGFLSFLENREWNRALILAKKAEFHQEAYLLFAQLFPEGNWLERGEFALRANQYEDAFQSFVQGNEIQAATKVAATLDSLDLLLSLARGRSKATIKVLILDPLEDLQKTELREQLIQQLKAEMLEN